MTISEINQTLALIDQWLQELQAERLGEECRKRGKTFFDFMQLRGVNAALMARMIIDATGYNPAQLWRVEMPSY